MHSLHCSRLLKQHADNSTEVGGEYVRFNGSLDTGLYNNVISERSFYAVVMFMTDLRVCI